MGDSVFTRALRMLPTPAAWQKTLTIQTLPRSTTTNLADITNAINTTDKWASKAVINTTTGAIVTAADATAGGLWLALDGTTAHTPV